LAADAVEPPTGVITTADSDHLLGIAKLEDRLIILLDLQQALLNLNQFDSYLDMALQIESDPIEPGGRGNIQNEHKKRPRPYLDNDSHKLLFLSNLDGGY
jgi:hypothetical protein